MTILVTGATGLIGSHLVEYLGSKGEDVISLVNSPPKGWRVPDMLFDNSKLEFGDIRDYEGLLEVISRRYVDKVYHLAALAEVKMAMKTPLSVYETNVMGCANILEASRSGDVAKVLVLITDKVYGEKTGAIETDRLNASEPYATSKVCQQYLCESYEYTYGMEVVYPHSCNVFGYDPWSNRIFPNEIKNCIQGVRPKIFINDKSVREYIYVKDLVEALEEVMENKTGSYNISTGWVFNNEKVVKEISKHFPGIIPETRSVKTYKQIQEQTMKTIHKQFKPRWTFDDAVEETVADFIRYRSDWDPTYREEMI